MYFAPTQYLMMRLCLGMGSIDESNLYYRFLDTYRERWRTKEHRLHTQLSMGTNFLQRFLYRLRECIASHFTKLILHSTRNYILSWIFLGFTSLIFGAIKGIESTNPLYTTGQTWLGIAVSVWIFFLWIE